MRTLGAPFPIVLALGAITLAPGLVRAQDFREGGPIEIEKCQTIDKLINPAPIVHQYPHSRLEGDINDR